MNRQAWAAVLGGLIVPARVRGWTVAALAVQAATFFVLVLGTHGLIVPLPHPTTTDFVSFYAAGQLGNGPVSALVYDRAAHYAAEQGATQTGISYVFFFYPPTFLLICGLLSLLGYLWAFVLFELLTTLVLVMLLRRVMQARTWWALLPVLSFSPLIWNIGLGQNAALTAMLFAGGTLLLQADRPVCAGLVLAGLCYKPHFALLIPVAFAASGCWRAVIAGGVGLVLWVALSVICFGTGAWTAFGHAIAQAQGEFSGGDVVPWDRMISVYGAAEMLGATRATAYAAEISAALATASCVIWSWSQPDDGTGIRHAVLVSGAILVMPVALFYDLVTLLVAAAWFVRAASDALRPGERIGLALAWFAGLLCYPIAGGIHLPAGTLCAAGLFAMALARQHRSLGSSSYLNDSPSF